MVHRILDQKVNASVIAILLVQGVKNVMISLLVNFARKEYIAGPDILWIIKAAVIVS